MKIFIAHWLIVLALWTLVIKYLFPVAYAVIYGEPVGTHIMWDFWWVAHLWLAYAILTARSYTWWLALLVSVVEIIIIVTKFILFLQAPQWSLWQTNWFINKLFVLACFCVLLAICLTDRHGFYPRNKDKIG